MLTRSETKIPSKSNKCHLCGLAGKACRDVASGYWCQRDGLISGPENLIHPTPDPGSLKIFADARVIEADANMAAAEAAYEAAAAAHRDATMRCINVGAVPERERFAILNSDPSTNATTFAASNVRTRGERKAQQAALDAEVAARNDLDDAAIALGRVRPVYHETVSAVTFEVRSAGRHVHVGD